MIKNLIFDFGGVILKHRSTIMEEFLSKMFSLTLEEAHKLWIENKKKLMTGKITSEEFIKKLKKDLNSPTEINKLLKMWRGLYKKEANNVDYELLNLIDKLKSKFKVYLFTDTIDVHDEYNSKRNIYNKFDKVFKSFKEGLIKPEKEAYFNILSKIKTKPKDCLFIDDLEINIKTAQEIGMKGIVYKNIKQLKNDLIRIDLVNY